MQIDAEEYRRRLKAINEASDILSLRQAFLHALNQFGISKLCQLAPITANANVPRIITLIGLPWAWERQYRSKLHLIDPLPQIAKDKLEAFVWPEQIDIENLSKKQRRFLELARQYGAGRGIGMACFGPEGRSTFLGAMLEADAPMPDNDTLLRIGSIGQNLMQSYCRLVPSATDTPILSNREMEVLHWMAQGKSNSVIAEILRISPSSVDVYVRRIFSKLEVSDRTMAAVKALSLGLIVSSNHSKMVEEAARLQESGDPAWQ